ncbi:hypothetical protein SDC9_163499 [bioreactor metagenome]|uniref:Uncharacterized protein n=1 Tax=bioreactor metagenome TaxID=1076179 RepID=A0A645FP07_9ZZZZ
MCFTLRKTGLRYRHVEDFENTCTKDASKFQTTARHAITRDSTCFVSSRAKRPINRLSRYNMELLGAVTASINIRQICFHLGVHPDCTRGSKINSNRCRQLRVGTHTGGYKNHICFDFCAV